MPDLEAINNHVQHRLKQDRLPEVTAVDAAAWLDEAGLLKDSPERRGRTLRNYLRAGKIVGAVQIPKRKNGNWFIRPVKGKNESG